MDKRALREHVILSVFSMTELSHFSTELTSYVVGIKEETVVKILKTCKKEYQSYIKTHTVKNRTISDL